MDRSHRCKDYVTGEEINYTYDTLNGLTRAETVGPEWGQSYTFDGFGNLMAQTVSDTTNCVFLPIRSGIPAEERSGFVNIGRLDCDGARSAGECR